MLELEAVTPSPQLAVALDNELKEPIHITYMERTCLDKAAGQALTYDVSETRFSSPRYIFVVCMKNDRNLFRHSDVNYIQVVVDSETYPNLQQNAKFLENRFTKFYQSFADISKYFHGGSALSMKEYKDLYTVFGVDISNQKDKVRGVNSNVSIRVNRNAIPANDNDLQTRSRADWYMLFLTEHHIKFNALAWNSRGHIGVELLNKKG